MLADTITVVGRADRSLGPQGNRHCLACCVTRHATRDPLLQSLTPGRDGHVIGRPLRRAGQDHVNRAARCPRLRAAITDREHRLHFGIVMAGVFRTVDRAGHGTEQVTTSPRCPFDQCRLTARVATAPGDVIHDDRQGYDGEQRDQEHPPRTGTPRGTSGMSRMRHAGQNTCPDLHNLTYLQAGIRLSGGSEPDVPGSAVDHHPKRCDARHRGQLLASRRHQETASRPTRHRVPWCSGTVRPLVADGGTTAMNCSGHCSPSSGA